MDFTIDIIDDEQGIREGLALYLGNHFRVRTFASGEDGLSHIINNPPDILLLDINLPGLKGLDVLKEIKQRVSQVTVVMITARDDALTGVSAMKLGAYDYLQKPLEIEVLDAVLKRVMDNRRLYNEVQELQKRSLQENMPFFIGESNTIQHVMELVETVARSSHTPVLILGETGTGKELLARTIHFRSPNYLGRLVTVNCAAIPKELIESELFGYEKGAFTGASNRGKKGLIEEAENGTLFLDEIGDLSLEAQAKLLRFLEQGEFYRIGGTRIIHVNVRVVSATNKNIEAMIEKEQFRRDLYYRLSVVTVQVPSLNQRPDCIMPLAKQFLEEFASKFNKTFTGFRPEVEAALKVHAWKGNIRELRNMMERAALMARNSLISLEELGLSAPEKSGSPAVASQPFPPLSLEGIDLSALQQEMERFYVEEALRLASGNESKAARLLNINHHTYRYHLKKIRSE